MLKPLNEYAVISNREEANEYITRCVIRLLNNDIRYLSDKEYNKLLTFDGEYPTAKLITAKPNNHFCLTEKVS